MSALRSLLLVHIALAAALPLTARQESSSSPFALYAYGEGIGGAPAFSSGVGQISFGDHRLDNSTDAAPVMFSLNGNGGLSGSPNTSAISGTPSWSNLTFQVPGASSTSHEVGFVGSNSSASVVVTTGFILYGRTLFMEDATGGLQSLWYALPSEIDGVWTLNWNETGDTSTAKVPLTMRTIPPSNSS